MQTCPGALACSILLAVPLACSPRRPWRPQTSSTWSPFVLTLTLMLLGGARPSAASLHSAEPAPPPQPLAQASAGPSTDAARPPATASTEPAAPPEPAAPTEPASKSATAPEIPEVSDAEASDATENTSAKTLGPDDIDNTPASADAKTTDAAPVLKPPRVDGIYVGLTAYVPLTFARVRILDTAGVFVGPGGSLRAGEVVYPWMTIGIELTGEFAYRSDQRVGQGALLIDVGFLPMPTRPLSLHLGFGVGGGAVREEGIEDRSGFGGAAFKASARYEFFPLAARLRPRRGGGFGLGPELGWFGMTPAAAGRPMSNSIYLGLTTTYYFGS